MNEPWRRDENYRTTRLDQDSTYRLDQHHVHRTWPNYWMKGVLKLEWERLTTKTTFGRCFENINRWELSNSPPRTLHQFGYHIVLLECERFPSLYWWIWQTLKCNGMKGRCLVALPLQCSALTFWEWVLLSSFWIFCSFAEFWIFRGILDFLLFSCERRYRKIYSAALLEES